MLIKYKILGPALNDFDSVNLRWASGYFSICLTIVQGESDESDLATSFATHLGRVLNYKLKVLNLLCSRTTLQTHVQFLT